MTTLRILAAILGLAAATAQANFHLWAINEIYSNADGSVQFIELTALTGGQEVLAGHELTSISGTTVRRFTFPANLPGDTTGARMLIATQGFAILGVVTPDYVVPNGFFFSGGGTVDFAGADVWNYGALPTDGRSLNRNGSTAINSPQNFAGRTGTVSSTVPLNFQALWWRSPAGSESGWGLNIAHQGDILFATWFTYDADGSGMWLVVPDARRGSGNSYSGAMYRTTGPAFNSAPFNPALIGVTQVGSATFDFADANTGTFAYTVNGISQSKPITRQIFDVAVPTCTAGGSVGASPNYQDLWWNAPGGSESGWGVNVTHQGNILFATWFTYDASGRGLWLVMPDGRLGVPGTYSGRLYRTTGAPFNAVPWNPALIGVTDVGLATFAFTAENAGTFSYSVNGISQTKSITRQSFGVPATVCR